MVAAINWLLWYPKKPIIVWIGPPGLWDWVQMESLKFRPITVFKCALTSGEQIFTQHVDLLYGLARQLANYIQQQPGFELAVTPESNIVCFRYVGSETNLDRISSLNTAIRQQMLTDGQFYIVQTTLRGQVWLRVSIMNSLTTMEHLKEMTLAVKRLGETV